MKWPINRLTGVSRFAILPGCALLTWLSSSSVTAAEDDTISLVRHLTSVDQFKNLRGTSVTLEAGDRTPVITVEVPSTDQASGKAHRVAWAGIPAPAEGWNLSQSQFVRATIHNTGSADARVTLWASSPQGWAAVGGSDLIPSGETRLLTCKLRESYPDGTPKIDPTKVDEVRLMIHRASKASLKVSKLVASGSAEPWLPPERLEVPDMQTGDPAPGKRVRYRLASDAGNDIYAALYLPDEWQADGSYPIIVEFPGNQFFSASACWSTGRPEQCVMGYGITKGKGAIWVSLPFVDRESGSIAEIGFGSNDGDDTAAYTMRVIDELCDNWAGDRDNLFLSGFSRGAIACGYIGLRNDEIAKLWKGFVACQHYDGSGWRQSTMKSAVSRAPRFGGEAIFQIDNSAEKYAPVVAATDPDVDWTWVDSGLDYHATAMFLDDRPSTRQLREWFQRLTGKR